MKTRAGVLLSAPGPFDAMEVDLERPRPGELLVKLAASGLCHSDDHIATGNISLATYPMCGGHEGSGEVVEVGPNTSGWDVGDHVVLSFIPACGRCRWCSSGRQNLCDLGQHIRLGSRYYDPTSYRMALHGRPVGQYGSISTFSEFTSVHVNSAIKVPRDIPLEPLCLVAAACAPSGELRSMPLWSARATPSS